MKTNHIIFKPCVLLLSAIFAMSGCTKEPVVDTKHEDDPTVTFAIKLPGQSAPSTRALSETDENEVTRIDVLAFGLHGGTFAYRASSNTIASSGTGGNTKNFTVKLRRGEYDLVVLANAGEIIDNASLTGLYKSDALALLLAEMPADGKWVATRGAAGYKPFPMWGDVGNTNVTATTTDISGTIPLTRMTARVNVVVTADQFALRSVDVYNYNTHGSLVPAESAWDSGLNKAVAPDVPSSSTRPSTPIRYDGAAIAGGSCINEIYLFEAENHSDAPVSHDTPKALAARTAIVVGGVWGTDAVPSYYRLDFLTGTTTQTLLDVLRNHKYTFNITEVYSRGHDTPEEAFASNPANMKTEILVWNESEGGEVYFDGDNYLFLRPESVLNLWSTANSGEVTIRTDVPAGWIVDRVTESNGTTPIDQSTGWLRVDKIIGTPNGAGEVDVPMTISVTASTASATRTGYIFITAGGLEVRITVNQEPPGVLAAPGVIGYIASGDPANIGKLTLRGSREFAGTPVDINSPFGSGNLETETVYVAYFRWASLVALDSQPKPTSTFNASNVVWAPAQFSYPPYTGLEGAVRKVAAEGWAGVPNEATNATVGWDDLTPSNGLGNPCRFYFDDDGNMNPDLSGDYLDAWRMPMGGFYIGWNDGISFGKTSVSSTPNWSLDNGARWVPLGADGGIPVAGAVAGAGAGQPDWSMFLPLSGGRHGSAGLLFSLGTPIYWSGTHGGGDTSAYVLSFSSNGISPIITTTTSSGYTIRCIQVEKMLTLDPDVLTFAFDEAVNVKEVTVTTNVADGWMIADVSEDWINVNPDVGQQTLGSNLLVHVSTNIEIGPRTGYITITAGNRTETVTVIQAAAPGHLASPGVIGYIASGDPANLGRLTLRGSKEFSGTLVDTNSPFGSGGLESETVYVAYFKWASLAALGSQGVPAFNAANIVWAPHEFSDPTYGNGLAGVRARAATEGWAGVPSRDGSDAETLGWGTPNISAGLGDPCAFYFDDEGRLSHNPSDNNKWRLPVGGVANGGWNSGSFGLGAGLWGSAAVNGAQWFNSGAAGGLPIPGAVAGTGSGIDWSMFLPAAWHRMNTNGNLMNIPDFFDGRYWSGTAANATQGSNLQFNMVLALGGDSNAFAAGYAVRCVPAPPWGGEGDILYFDGDGRLQVGRWGANGDPDAQITPTNYETVVAYFQFGSVIGFDLNGFWQPTSSIRFNPTSTASFTYTAIPNYTSSHGSGNAWTNGGSHVLTAPSVSSPAYHNAVNLAAGKGDPCKLVGLNSTEAQGMSGAELAAHNSGWRLPTARENIDFMGSGPYGTGAQSQNSWDNWQPGNGVTAPELTIASSSFPAGRRQSGTWSTTNLGWVDFPTHLKGAQLAANEPPTYRLPATGYRNSTNGSVTGRGTIGFYWSSTAGSGTNGFNVYFGSSFAYPVSSYNFPFGMSVRCVSTANDVP